MTGQSPVTDYISIILRAIEKAQNDPARLRRLVYDIARINLGKQVLMSYGEIGSAGLQKHLSDLEFAINRVEVLSRLESETLPNDAHVRLLGGPVSSHAGGVATVRDHASDANLTDLWEDDAAFMAHRESPQIHDESDTTTEFLPLAQISEPVPAEPPKRDRANRLRKLELPIAILVGVAIYAVILVQSNYFRGFDFPRREHGIQGAAVSTPSTAQTSRHGASSPFAGVNSAATTRTPEFPLPSIYGVYAVSQKTLYALASLAMKVPDPRVGVSAMISNPSRVTVPNGKLAFVVYRRDLASSAPDTVFVRVVARVMRELKFSATRPPSISKIDGQWAIRSKSYEFGVAPLNNNPEMVVLRPLDAQSSLSPGRYVLVFKGEGYDFSVSGQITDPAQCLERTDAVGGKVYSECRDL